MYTFNTTYSFLVFIYKNQSYRLQMSEWWRIKQHLGLTCKCIHKIHILCTTQRTFCILLVLFMQYGRCYSVNTTSVPRCDAWIKLCTKRCIRIRHPLLQMNRFFDSFWYSSSGSSSVTSPPPKPSLLFLFTLFPVSLLFLEVHNRVDKAKISIFRRLREHFTRATSHYKHLTGWDAWKSSIQMLLDVLTLA